MASFPTGEYRCFFNSSSFKVEDLGGNPVAEVSIDYSQKYIYIELDNSDFIIGTSEIEYVERDDFHFTDVIEVGTFSVENAVFIISSVENQSFEYNLSDLTEIRIIKIEGELKVYTDQ